jgi:type II secretory pathway component PulF
MNDPSKPTISVQEMLQFNQYLLALEKAGLPIALDFGMQRESLKDQLAAISSDLMIDCKDGKFLEEAVLGNQKVPLQYRESLLAWWAGDRCPDAVAPLHAIGNNLQDSRRRVELAYLSPLIVTALGYLVLLCLSFTFVKNLEVIYLDTATVPGWGWRIMKGVRDWLPVWGIVIPILLVATWFWIRQGSSRLGLSQLGHSLFTPRSKEIIAAQKQNVSETLSILVGNQKHPVDGRQLQAIHSLGVHSSGAFDSPLTQWAQHDGSSYFRTSDALLFAASFHQDARERSAHRWHFLLPAVLGAGLGGAVVLALGLGLFTPVMELLSSISQP